MAGLAQTDRFVENHLIGTPPVFVEVGVASTTGVALVELSGFTVFEHARSGFVDVFRVAIFTLCGDGWFSGFCFMIGFKAHGDESNHEERK